MGAGRYFCVALPFILTVASIICVLIAGLTGVVNNNLYLLKVNLTDVSIDPSELAAFVNGYQDIKNADLSNAQIQTTLQNIENNIGNLGGNIPSNVQSAAQNAANQHSGDVQNAVSQHTGRSGTWHDSSLIQELGIPTGSSQSSGSKNITATQLGFADSYTVTIWGYCADWPDNTHNCTKPAFNWAENKLNTEAIDRFNKLAGINVTIPQQFNDGLKAFEQTAKWTQVVFIIACLALGIEFVVGIFTACSRAVSCVTWLVSWIASIAVIAAAAMMTALAFVVVGAVEGSGSKYGADAHVNNSFLAVIWIGVAFALGASFFWVFSICCCKPESRPHKSKGYDSEKLLPTGSYEPVGTQPAPNAYNYGVPNHGAARSDLAYEPYSHTGR